MHTLAHPVCRKQKPRSHEARPIHAAQTQSTTSCSTVCAARCGAARAVHGSSLEWLGVAVEAEEEMDVGLTLHRSGVCQQGKASQQ